MRTAALLLFLAACGASPAPDMFGATRAEVTRGGVEPFDGDLDDYQRFLLDEAKRAREELKIAQKDARDAKAAASAPPPPPPAAARKPSANLKALKRDQGKLEQAMLERQTRKHALEARLSGPLPVDEIAELGRELKKLDEELADDEERWLLLAEQIEAEEA